MERWEHCSNSDLYLSLSTYKTKDRRQKISVSTENPDVPVNCSKRKKSNKRLEAVSECMTKCKESRVDLNRAENWFMSTPACLFMVYLTQLNINLFKFYSFTNCLSSLFQQSVRLISLCNRLSRSFLSRSNISVARSDDTLVSYICSVLLRNQKSCWRKIMETLKTRTVKIFIHLFFWLTLHILFQSSSFIFMW